MPVTYDVAVGTALFKAGHPIARGAVECLFIGVSHHMKDAEYQP